MIVLKDLIVCDEEYIALAEKYKELGETFDRYYYLFVSTLNRIQKQGISSGLTNKNILYLISYLDNLKEKLSYSTDLASTLCSLYLQNIEKADDELFKGENL